MDLKTDGDSTWFGILLSNSWVVERYNVLVEMCSQRRWERGWERKRGSWTIRSFFSASSWVDNQKKLKTSEVRLKILFGAIIHERELSTTMRSDLILLKTEFPIARRAQT